MKMYENISGTASLFADPTRASILMALADGRALPAGELATIAGVSPQTASAHLGKLAEGGLIAVERQGRHRYYRLAGPEVAEAIEAIAIVAPPVRVRSLRESSHKKALDHARTCYGHLAGKVSVAFADALVAKGYFEEVKAGYGITDKGRKWLEEFGVQTAGKKIDWNAIPYHIDWTVRKRHIAGPLAVAITNRLLEIGWIERGRIRRSLQITEKGRSGFRDDFGMNMDDF